MNYSHHSLLLGLSSRKLITCTAALLAAFATTNTLAAQVVEAHYPLSADLIDASGNYSDMLLQGTPPPAPPAGGVCVNGIYYYHSNGLGQDARTPNIGNLNPDDFQLEVEFNVAAFHSYRMPIFIGGNGWRWIGFQVQPDGTFGLLHNNSVSEWSTVMLTLGTWYAGVIKYEAGEVELYLDGALVYQNNIGPLNTGGNLNFTTNNFSNGTNFEGCIREIVISNDTTLGSGPVGTSYCFGDGNGIQCPCVNNNNGSEGGCDWGDPNFPEGGVLDATGSDSFGANDTNLVATGVSNDFGIFFGANNQVNGGIGNPLNDGLRCAGGGLVRLIPPTAGSGNQQTTPLPVQTLDTGAAAGVTRRYQYWFRTPAGPCGQQANLTNGYEIVWMP